MTALRCFDASARLGSFTRAAQSVSLTQGAVSHQVLGLEAQLGVTLFVRRRAGLELTVAGRAYWSEVSAALRQLDRATQNLRMHKGQGGSLDLCCASSFASYWLLPRLPGFVAAHPEITLNLSTRIGPVDFSASGHDAAIEFCEGASPGLQAVKIHDLVLRPYVAAGRLAPRGAGPLVRDAAQLLRLLRRHPLIRHTTVPEAWSGWLRASGLHGRLDDAHLGAGPRYDLLSMALNGAIAGLGIALLPDFVAAQAERAGQLVRLSSTSWTAPRAYHLRYPDWKAELASLARLRQWIRQQADPGGAQASS